MRESLAKEHELKSLSMESLNQVNSLQKENQGLQKSVSMYSTLVEQQQKQIQKLQKRIAEITTFEMELLKRAEKAESQIRQLV